MQNILQKTKNPLKQVSAYFRSIAEQVQSTSSASSPAGRGVVGHIVNVRVCRHLTTRALLCHGLAKYSTSQDASTAKETVDASPLDEKPIGISYADNPTFRSRRATQVFIGNVGEEIDLKALEETFSSFGKLVSFRMATDSYGNPKTHGFVQFENEESAKKAVEKLNMLINYRQIYVAPSLSNRQRVAARKADFKDVFVKNLSETTTENDLMTVFGEHGVIERVTVMRDVDGNSKCFGFVKFESTEAAAKAIEVLNGKEFDGKEWFVVRAKNRMEREWELKQANFKCVFVKNLSETATESDLITVFGEHGVIEKVAVWRDADGKSKCFGFVNFESPAAAGKAIKALNGKEFDGKEWFVERAKNRIERERELKEAAEKSRRCTLFVKNLDESINEEKLKELFSPFGSLYSWKLLRSSEGTTNGRGFVAFRSPEEAEEARFQMNGTMVDGKALFVCFSTRREKKDELASQFTKNLSKPTASRVDGGGDGGGDGSAEVPAAVGVAGKS